MVGMSTAPDTQPDALTTLTRKPERQGDRALLDDILDTAQVGTLSTVVDGAPLAVPMLYARDGDRVLAVVRAPDLAVGEELAERLGAPLEDEVGLADDEPDPATLDAIAEQDRHSRREDGEVDVRTRGQRLAEGIARI